MSTVTLNWRTVTGSNDPKHLIDGSVLSVALFGPHSRFAAYEIRTYSRDEGHDRRYVVRDAAAISDDELRAGKPPPIVGRTDDYGKLMAFVEKQGAAMS